MSRSRNDIVIKMERGTDARVFRDAYAVRKTVFVEEQGIPLENEMDSLDATAFHCVGYVDGVPAACGRLSMRDGNARLGRIATVETFRHRGYASAICHALIALARDNGAERVYLHSQVAAREFYLTLGFAAVGDVFQEEDMPHIKMVLKAI